MGHENNANDLRVCVQQQSSPSAEANQGRYLHAIKRGYKAAELAGSTRGERGGNVTVRTDEQDGPRRFVPPKARRADRAGVCTVVVTRLFGRLRDSDPSGTSTRPKNSPVGAWWHLDSVRVGPSAATTKIASFWVDGPIARHFLKTIL